VNELQAIILCPYSSVCTANKRTYRTTVLGPHHCGEHKCLNMDEELGWTG